ncbi:hypothetical protein [Gimesia aquarii]|uniref:Carboxypeptidase regulatory-like domain-containing protein n=1 Tax=Gimesia aquarii TaxID=2527964 RepID=A0A517X2H1_9PLAN|nr:hypothetical protein [Gimesia aquarii]QDU11698.1 hypothetical protein V202x_51220 [Gimesia aquarii]
MKILSAFLILTCLAGMIVGCGGSSDGPATFPVSGKVTLDGEPLAEGDIIFRDIEGIAASAAGKIKGGAYSLRSTAGKKAVVITATKEIPVKTVV